MKILILKPSSLGDVVQALPVLRLIRLHWPRSEIFWWVDSALAPLLEGDPDLSGVVRFERRRWARPANWPEVLRSILWMRRQRFDLVIDLQGLARSGAFAWLANGAHTIGLDEPREGARGFYDVIVQRDSWHTHAVDWYLSVLNALKIPVHWNFEWLPERPDVALEVRRKWQTDSAPWIILQPGARWLNKRWPAEYYADFVRQFAQIQPDCRFAILGSNSERDLGSVVASADSERCLDLTGQLTLLEMVEWIRLSEWMISNDTGPMHVAAALGKPVVAIFGPTEPRRTGPYRQLDSVLQTRLPCVPCMESRCSNAKPLECMTAISPAMVVSEIAERFPRRRQAAGRAHRTSDIEHPISNGS